MFTLVKCSLGLFIGVESLFDFEKNELELNDACEIQLVPVPQQSRLGQTSIGMLTNINPWPAEDMTFTLKGDFIISQIEEETANAFGMEIIKLYRAARESMEKQRNKILMEKH